MFVEGSKSLEELMRASQVVFDVPAPGLAELAVLCHLNQQRASLGAQSRLCSPLKAQLFVGK